MKTITDMEYLTKKIKQYHIDSHFSDISKFYSYMSIREYEEKEEINLIFGNNIYYLINGSLELASNNAAGKMYGVWKCEAPVMMGDLELFEHAPQKMVLQALNKSRLFCLNITNIKQDLLKDPVFLYHIGQSLADKLCGFSMRSIAQSTCTLEENLAAYILHSASENGIFCETLKVVAVNLNTSYRHLLRVMKQFRDEHILEKCQWGYLIVNKKALEDKLTE